MRRGMLSRSGLEEFHCTFGSTTDSSDRYSRFLLVKSSINGETISDVTKMIQIRYRNGVFYLRSIMTLYTQQHQVIGRSQWPRGLWRESAASRLLRLWVRIPSGTWMFVYCEGCVLSGRGLCDELITRPEESYRLREWGGHAPLGAVAPKTNKASHSLVIFTFAPCTLMTFIFKRPTRTQLF